MSDDPTAFAEGVQEERARIRAAFKQRCGLHRQRIRDGAGFRCGLNRGHIGDCSPVPDTISITRRRLEEILDG